MIVRIAGEGQFRLPDEDAGRLNDLDNEAVAAAVAGDENRCDPAAARRLVRGGVRGVHR
jgi:hypothetical protein